MYSRNGVNLCTALQEMSLNRGGARHLGCYCEGHQPASSRQSGSLHSFQGSCSRWWGGHANSAIGDENTASMLP